MFNLLKADFYKIFRMKSFYICAFIGTVLAGISAFLFNQQIQEEFKKIQEYIEFLRQNGMMEELPKISGFTFIGAGLSHILLFVIIFSSIFVSSEFSHGTIKNIISRGKNRVFIYISKFISLIIVSIIFSLLAAGCAFGIGISSWGIGEISQQFIWNLLKMYGLFMFGITAFISICIMFAFLFRRTSAALIINIVLSSMVAPAILRFINYISTTWFNLKNFVAEDYWLDKYLQEFSQDFSNVNIAQNIINLGLIVCGSYLVVSLIVGIYTFCMRDID